MKVSKSMKMPTSGGFTAVWMGRGSGFTTSSDLLWMGTGLYVRRLNGDLSPVAPSSFIAEDCIYITSISDEDE